MYKRPHHQKIASLLRMFDSELLMSADCYFGGGTAIALSLDEYRESVDIDFLCGSQEGYRILRNTVSENDLGDLLKQPVTFSRDVRATRDKILTIIEMDGQRIKVELVRESRIDISGAYDPTLGVPVLSRCDMYAEKLLANADRGLDRSTMSRDAIDLAVMIECWGSIPDEAWQKVHLAYGGHAIRAFKKIVPLISNEDYLEKCLKHAQMDDVWLQRIPSLIKDEIKRFDRHHDNDMTP